MSDQRLQPSGSLDATQQSAHLFHTAPLRHLVKQVLHKGRTLESNVTRLRWRRRKARVTEPPAEGSTTP